MEELVLERNGRRETVKLAIAMISNGGDTIVHAAIAGAGITILPAFVGSRAVASGELEAVLAGWQVFPAAKLYAIHPDRRFVSPNTRAFIDFLGREIDAVVG